LIPVHGEALHLSEHADLARSLGIAVGLCRNGDLVRLAPGDPGIIDEIPAGRLYKDGNLLVDAQARTIADRKRLSLFGFVSIALALTERGQLAADPEIEMIGIPETAADGAPMLIVATDVIAETIETLPKARRRDPDSVAEAVRRSVRAAIAEQWGKKPLVHVHMLLV
jgi:ribonuclease J